MSREDDLWCDWCGGPNRVIYRHDGRVFCGYACIRRYRSQAGDSDVIDLPVRE